MSIKFIAIILLAALLFTLPASAQSISWRHYVHPEYGFSIDLPSGRFTPVEASQRAMSLIDPVDKAQLDVFASAAVNGITPSALLAEVQRADRIATVTYQKRGRSWFVLSGYYRRDAGETEDLIFYAKFMFNRAATAFSAFEISYRDLRNEPSTQW